MRGFAIVIHCLCGEVGKSAPAAIEDESQGYRPFLLQPSALRYVSRPKITECPPETLNLEEISNIN